MEKKKSIWHSAEERPTKDCSILIYDEYEEYKVAIYSKEWDTLYIDEAPDGTSFNLDDPFYRFDGWCYIDDLKNL